MTGSAMSTSGELEARATAAFVTQFGFQPTALGIAPGRVELLGNHTDYNGGLVMAVAIDRFTVVAGRPSTGRSCRAHAVNSLGNVSFDLDNLERGESGDWPNYVKGVVWAIQEAERAPLTSGFDMTIAGNVPLGAGLSSSASLEAALAFFLLQAGLVPGRAIGDFRGDSADLARLKLAQVLRPSENAFVDVASGLLDQFSSLFGRAHHAVYPRPQAWHHSGNPHLPRRGRGPGPRFSVSLENFSRSYSSLARFVSYLMEARCGVSGLDLGGIVPCCGRASWPI